MVNSFFFALKKGIIITIINFFEAAKPATHAAPVASKNKSDAKVDAPAAQKANGSAAAPPSSPTAQKKTASGAKVNSVPVKGKTVPKGSLDKEKKKGLKVVWLEIKQNMAKTFERYA